MGEGRANTKREARGNLVVSPESTRLFERERNNEELTRLTRSRTEEESSPAEARAESAVLDGEGKKGRMITRQDVQRERSRTCWLDAASATEARRAPGRTSIHLGLEVEPAHQSGAAQVRHRGAA